MPKLPKSKIIPNSNLIEGKENYGARARMALSRDAVYDPPEVTVADVYKRTLPQFFHYIEFLENAYDAVDTAVSTETEKVEAAIANTVAEERTAQKGNKKALKSLKTVEANARQQVSDFKADFKRRLISCLVMMQPFPATTNSIAIPKIQEHYQNKIIKSKNHLLAILTHFLNFLFIPFFNKMNHNFTKCFNSFWI